MSKGEKTREKILAKAVNLASVTGLEDLTIGKLAKATKLSKSGLFAHFNSKKSLQEQVIKTVSELFMKEVMNPAIKEPRGVPRIRAIFRNWKEWIDGGSVPGGCLTIASALEFDDRPGTVREKIVEMVQDLLDMLSKAARIAVYEGHFNQKTDSRQFAYEFVSLICGYHLHSRLLNDPKSEERSEEALDRLIAEYSSGQAAETNGIKADGRMTTDKF